MPPDLPTNFARSSTIHFSRELSLDEWRVLRSRRYRNVRWRLEAAPECFWILRLSANLGYHLTVRESPTGVQLGPIAVYGAGGTSPEQYISKGSEWVSSLLDDALKQGKFYFTDVLFAVVGDVHGHMDLMVETLGKCEARLGENLHFVLQVGGV